MSVSFNHAEVFPVIARLITKASAHQRGFVDHRTIVSLLTTDTEGRSIVDRATPSSDLSDAAHVASNMVAWFSQRITIASSPWSDFFDRERRPDGWAYRPITAAQPSLVPECDLIAIEGNPQMYFHLRRERDPAIAGAKRNAIRALHGALFCECCGFTTDVAFPGLDAEICEIHHRVPLAFASEPVQTRLEDLAVLCPNCHRAIHRTNPLMPVEVFRSNFFVEADTDPIGS